MPQSKVAFNKALISRPIIYDEALITSVLRYGEADCIVRLFTLGQGRLSAFYKKGSSAKKTGVAQALALGQVGLMKNQGKLLRMVSCDLDPGALNIFDVRSFAYRAYLAELIEKFLPEEEPALEMFLAIKQAFLAIEKAPCSSILRAFEVKLLDYCGYWPEMIDTEVIAFDPQNFRFLDKVRENAWEFSSKAMEMAQSMLIAKIGSINYEGPSELLMIGRIFQNRVRLMGCELKSASFLKQLNQY